MERPLRIIYAAGPGDVIGTFRNWKEQQDDPSQVSLTYSGQFYDVCREANAQGYVLSAHPTAAFLQDGNFTLEHRPKPLPGAHGWLYHLAEIWYGLRLVATAARWRADLLVVAEGTTHWFVLFLLPLLRIKLAPTIHCVLWPKFKQPGTLQRALNRLAGWLFRNGSLALMSASDEITAQLQTLTDGHPRPVVPFLPTYRRQTFAALNPPPANHTPFRVLFAGRIERNKGVFDLLSIAQRFAADGRHDIEFDLCGAGSALEPLRTAVADAGLVARFRCHGHCTRDVMQKMLQQAHVLIVPTTTDFIEGFNQVVVEGILAGRPVVTSSICPALAYVRAAVVEVAPDDVLGYGDALLRLKSDAQFYAQKQQACLGYQEQFYDPALGWAAALKQVIVMLQARSQVANATLPLPLVKDLNR